MSDAACVRRVGRVRERVAERLVGEVGGRTGGRTAVPSKGGAVPVSEAGTEIVLYVPGAYQDWKPAAAPQIAAVTGSMRRFEGYVNFTGTGE